MSGWDAEEGFIMGFLGGLGRLVYFKIFGSFFVYLYQISWKRARAKIDGKGLGLRLFLLDIDIIIKFVNFDTSVGRGESVKVYRGLGVY